MNIILRLNIFVVFLFLPAFGMAQDVVEPLLRDFDARPSVKAANVFFGQLLKEELLDEPLLMAEKTPLDTLRQQVWYWAAEYYYDRQDYALAGRYAEKALPLCHVGGNRLVEGDCLSLLSLINVRQGRFDEAARYAKKCNDLDMKMGDPDNISSSLNTLAGIYMSMRQPKEAEHYILKAIDYCQKAGNTQRLAVLYGTASEIYHHLEKDEEALDYASRAYDIEVKAGRKDKAAIRQAQRAAALKRLHRTAEAMKALEEAIPEFRSNGNRHSLGIACNQMGLLLRQERRDSDAVPYLEEALQIFVEQHDIFNESQSRKSLYNLLKTSNPTLAMQHMERYEELRDSLYDRETGELLQKYAAEYGAEQLLKENADERSAHMRDLLLTAGLLLVLALLVWLLRRRLQRHEKRRVAELTALTTQVARLKRENEQLLAQLVEEVKTGNSQGDTADQAGEVSREAGGNSDDEGLTPQENQQHLLLKVIGAINNGMTNGDYSVESIADALNMSPSTFRRRLIDATGESPKNYITAIQMDKARQLLTDHPQMAIAKVARQCGFDDAANFSRVFKRIYGIAPSKYGKGEE